MYKIIDINWDRANLVLKFDKVINEKCFLVSSSKKIELAPEKDIIRISITNLPIGQSLEMGEYRVLINDLDISIDKDLIKKLDDKSRIFKYRNNYAMLVYFEITESLVPTINIDYMIKNYKYKKKILISEGKTINEKLLIIIKTILILLLNIFYKIVRFFSFNKKNTILFLSENTSNLNGNLDYLYNNIKEYKNKNIKVFLYDKSNNKTITNYIKEVVNIAKSNIIIIDNYVSVISVVKLSKSQKIVQLWHAGVGFKAVGYARFGKKGGPHPFKSSHRNYDMIFVDREELIDIYKEVFGCDKSKFIVSGMPRLDSFLNPKTIKEKVSILENNYPQLKNKKIILFSPTYRGESSENAYYDYDKIKLKKIHEYCEKNNFVFVIKMHPFIKEKINIPNEYKNTILDLSICDINDIIYISDIMITDYSSCVYEYSLFNRPLIFYRYDKEIYEYLRPMHTLDLFTKEQYEVKTFDDLLEILNKLKDINIKDRFKKIKEHDNKSCDIISKKIIKEK